MSFLPPRANPYLIGHQQAEHLWLQAFKNNRLHHGWMLIGPQGIGKATLAFRMARMLLAYKDPTNLHDLNLPPTHPVFCRVAAQGHGDLLVIERSIDSTGKTAREISVEDVRDVKSFLSKTPLEGGRRVVIVDSICQTNRKGANAILKVLEEPPTDAVLILICHQLGKVLPTIRSRCQKLQINRLTDEQVLQTIKCQKDSIPSEEDPSLYNLSQISETTLNVAEGSPGKLLSFLALKGEALQIQLQSLLKQVPKAAPHALTSQIQNFLDKTFTEYKSQEAEVFDIVSSLLNQHLHQLIKDQALSFKALSHNLELDSAFEVWEKNQNLLQSTRSLSLDRKQALISAFDAVSTLTASLGVPK